MLIGLNDAVICELPLIPKVTWFELANTTVPLVAVCVPAAMFGPVWFVTPPPPTDSCNPLLFSVAVAFVKLNPVPAYPAAFMLIPELFTVQVTLLWAVFKPTASLLALAVVKYAPTGWAVVKNAGMFKDKPELLTVHATPFAVNAVFNPTASLLALAVVRYAPTG